MQRVYLKHKIHAALFVFFMGLVYFFINVPYFPLWIQVISIASIVYFVGIYIYHYIFPGAEK